MDRAIKSDVSVEDLKETCKKSLWFLATQILGYDDWDQVHDDLEKTLAKPAKRKLILIPRGHLKTSIITKAYSIKRILNDPNIRILLVNQVWDRSRDMLFEIKEFLTSKSILPKLFGEFTSGRWRDEEIVIKQRNKAFSAPTVGTTGVEAEMTSAHFDLIIIDDPMGLNNCQTKEQRDKVKKFIRSLTSILEQDGEMIVLGTRWHEDDCYQEIIDNESKYYDIVVRQVVEDGKIIFPKKFNLKFDEHKKNWVHVKEPTMDFINFLRQSKGPDFFSQYMNQPIDEATALIKRDYFQYYQRPPDNLFRAMAIDLALTNKQRSDYTAMITAGMDSKREIYVLDTLRGRWANPSDIVNNVFLMYEKWHPTVVGIETMGFQKTLKIWIEQEMRKRNIFFYIKELKTPPTMKKEYRTKSLEPFYRNKMVYHQQWMKDLEGELLCLSMDGFKGKHDDMVDTMAHLLGILSPGDVNSQPKMQDGCWEMEAQIARKAAMSPYNFFQD